MNEFKLLGRVGTITMDYKESGSVITKVNLGVKKNKTEWENFWITFFNTKNHATAEILGDMVQEGDRIRVDGKLTISSFTPTWKDKPVNNIQLLGWGFKKVKWSEQLKKYIDIEA